MSKRVKRNGGVLSPSVLSVLFVCVCAIHAGRAAVKQPLRKKSNQSVERKGGKEKKREKKPRSALVGSVVFGSWERMHQNQMSGKKKMKILEMPRGAVLLSIQVEPECIQLHSLRSRLYHVQSRFFLQRNDLQRYVWYFLYKHHED